MPGETVFVAATEPFAEVVVVVALRQVVAAIAEVGILIAVRLLIVRGPVVLAIGASGLESLLIAVVHRLAHDVGAVPVGFPIGRPDGIAEGHWRRVVRVALDVARGIESLLLQPQVRRVLLVHGVLRAAFLLLQRRRRLLCIAHPVGERRLVRRVALALIVHALLLLLRRDGL